jgi:hypothetical protein
MVTNDVANRFCSKQHCLSLVACTTFIFRRRTSSQKHTLLETEITVTYASRVARLIKVEAEASLSSKRAEWYTLLILSFKPRALVVLQCPISLTENFY